MKFLIYIISILILIFTFTFLAKDYEAKLEKAKVISVFYNNNEGKEYWTGVAVKENGELIKYYLDYKVEDGEIIYAKK